VPRDGIGNKQRTPLLTASAAGRAAELRREAVGQVQCRMAPLIEQAQAAAICDLGRPRTTRSRASLGEGG